MDYEKEYKEALERAKKLKENPKAIFFEEENIHVSDYIFPELAKSEDERIRKDIIRVFKGEISFTSEKENKKYIAWLEKQKSEEINVKALLTADRLAAAEMTGRLKERKDIVENPQKYGLEKQGGIDNCPLEGSADCVTTDSRKQGEQNHSEQDLEMVAKPKFNIGDWIVSDKPYINNDYRLCKVVEISDGYYTIQTIDGLKGYNTFKEWESDYHLWSIKDAKKGDVLSSELCGTIMLYKGIEDNNIQFYCDYDFSDIDVPGARFAINNGQHYGSVDDFDDWHPATKEQRDLLFQKMHEAGYTFDFESKELKKIELKPALDIEIPFGAKDSELQEVTYFTEGFHAEIKDDEVIIKKGKQKSTWSEEDEDMFAYALDMIEWYGGKDEHKTRIVSDWLKYLKQRYTWKPSVEQMKSLDSAIDEFDGYQEFCSLVSLKKDLEKLKEK